MPSNKKNKAAVASAAVSPSATSTTTQKEDNWKWNFRFLHLLIVTTVLRVLFAAIAELKYEEAYYWLYSQHLDWSYFDHPAMIAWMIRLCTFWTGDAEIWVRMPAILCFAGTMLCMHRLACELFNARAAFIMAGLAAVLPAFEFYSIFSLPDAPLLFFWSLGLYLGYRLYKSENPYWWLGLGVATGLAILSKYPGIFTPLAPILLVYIKKKYKLFKTWQFVLGTILALLLTFPIFYWNSQHQWASFLFQGLSRLGEANSLRETFGGSLLCITALPTPRGFILLLWVAWQSWKRRNDERWLYLICGFVPFAIVIALIATIRLVQLNWPLPAYPALTIATAALLEEGQLWKKRSWQFILGMVLLPALLVSSVPWLAVFTNFTALNRFNELYGWKFMAKTSLELLSAQKDSRYCFLAGHAYQTASELAYYSKLPQVTLGSNVVGERCKNFDFWSQTGDYKGWNCIYVVAEELHSDGTYSSREPFNVRDLERHFESISTTTNRQTVYRGGKPVRRYKFYQCFNYKGIPPF